MILLSCFDTVDAFPMVYRSSSLAVPQVAWPRCRGIREILVEKQQNGGWSWINGNWEKRQERRKTAMSPKQQRQRARKYCLVWTELNMRGLVDRLESTSRPQGLWLSEPRESGIRGWVSDEGSQEQKQPSHPEGQWHWGPSLKGQLGNLVTMA